MAKSVVVYVVVAQSDGHFAVIRTGGDLPERVVMVLGTRKHAQNLADELNHAYMAGWHDCLIEELALRRGEGLAGEETERKRGS